MNPLLYFFYNKFNEISSNTEKGFIRNYLKDNFYSQFAANPNNINLFEVFTLYSKISVSVLRKPMIAPLPNINICDEADYIVTRLTKAYHKPQKKIDYYYLKGNHRMIINELLDSLGLDFDYLAFNSENLKNLNSKYSINIKSKLVIIGFLIIFRSLVKDIKKKSLQNKIQYKDDGEERCLFNAFNLYFHYLLLNKKTVSDNKVKDLFFCASALHPVQDDYIDLNDIDNFYFEELENIILGKKSKKKNSTFKLINIIYSYFPTNENPQLVKILQNLLYWQKKSMMQKEKFLNTNEILKITFMKGGYAFAFYGYLVIGKLTPMQFRHFFTMGAMFQLMDDFHDIETDIENGINTVWTSEIKANLTLDKTALSVMRVQNEIEFMTPVINSFKSPIAMKHVETIGCRFDFIKFYCLNHKYFSDNFKKELSRAVGTDLSKFLHPNLEMNTYKKRTCNNYIEIINDWIWKIIKM